MSQRRRRCRPRESCGSWRLHLAGRACRGVLACRGGLTCRLCLPRLSRRPCWPGGHAHPETLSARCRPRRTSLIQAVSAQKGIRQPNLTQLACHRAARPLRPRSTALPYHGASSGVYGSPLRAGWIHAGERGCADCKELCNMRNNMQFHAPRHPAVGRPATWAWRAVD